MGNGAKFSGQRSEEKPAERKRLNDPEEEFRARITARHPDADPEDLLKKVQRTLARNGNAGLRDFLERDLKNTTGKVNNPGGYYTALAKAVAAESMTMDWKPSPEPEKPQETYEYKRCPKCKGVGFLMENSISTDFCDCKLGKDLKLSTRGVLLTVKKTEAA
jgi:hypothetical protein